MLTAEKMHFLKTQLITIAMFNYILESNVLKMQALT